VLDQDLARLQLLDVLCHGGSRIATMVSHTFNLRKVVKFADVLVGAVLVPGERAPVVITRDMVRLMKPRSVILDISIDQGGCVETSRPTTHRDPTFVEENIIHYCVPNMTSVVARTATHAMNNVTWPFVFEIARSGLRHALTHMPALKRGVVTHSGRVTNAAVAARIGLQEAVL
jgi:alanine dehydrogenase